MVWRAEKWLSESGTRAGKTRNYTAAMGSMVSRANSWHDSIHNWFNYAAASSSLDEKDQSTRWGNIVYHWAQDRGDKRCISLVYTGGTGGHAVKMVYYRNSECQVMFHASPGRSWFPLQNYPIQPNLYILPSPLGRIGQGWLGVLRIFLSHIHHFKCLFFLRH